MPLITPEENLFSPDEEARLRDLVFSKPTITQLLVLIRAQQKFLCRPQNNRKVQEALAKAIYSTALQISEFAAEDVNFLLGMVEKHGEALILQAVEEANRLRPTTRLELKDVMQPDERAEKYYEQYEKALAALTSFGIETKDAPTWKQIKAALTPEQLDSLRYLQQPILVLTPPMTRQQMVSAINKQKERFGIKRNTYVYDCDNDRLYNDGKPEEHPTWEVSIVEGVTDMGVNVALQMENGQFRQNHKQVAALLKDLKEKGLEALSGARSYLAAMIVALANGQPIDVQNWTVLNTNIVLATNQEELISGANWFHGQVYLNLESPLANNDKLRLRCMVEINLK